MPRNSKQKQQLEAARNMKRKRSEVNKSQESELDTSALLQDLEDYSYEEDDNFEQEFDVTSAIQTHANEWVETLSRDDTMSLTLLVYRLQFPLTKAAEITAEVVGVSDRTVREWRGQFTSNKVSFLDSDQGQRSGVLWHNEELNKLARQFVQKNTCVKGTNFCKLVNEVLLMNSFLNQDIPGKSPALRW